MGVVRMGCLWWRIFEFVLVIGGVLVFCVDYLCELFEVFDDGV